MDKIKEFLLKLITSRSGVSSKRFVGAICYIMITVAVIVLSFVNPGFSGLSEIIITLIITTASLLGMTTIENLKHLKKEDKKDEII